MPLYLSRINFNRFEIHGEFNGKGDWVFKARRWGALHKPFNLTAQQLDYLYLEVVDGQINNQSFGTAFEAAKRGHSITHPDMVGSYQVENGQLLYERDNETKNISHLSLAVSLWLRPDWIILIKGEKDE